MISYEKIANGVVVSIEQEGISQQLLAFRRRKWALDAPCYVGELMLRLRHLCWTSAFNLRGLYRMWHRQ